MSTLTSCIKIHIYFSYKLNKIMNNKLYKNLFILNIRILLPMNCNIFLLIRVNEYKNNEIDSIIPF
jgi:hypothetical protein